MRNCSIDEEKYGVIAGRRDSRAKTRSKKAPDSESHNMS